MMPHIGKGQAVWIVAEIGVCHNGDLATALRLVDAAADAGADAVKCQAWTARDGDPYANLRLDAADLAAIQQETQARGLTWFCTPHDAPAVAVLEDLGVTLYKVGSAGLANLALLEAVAATGKPVLMSTGMAWADEIQAAADHFWPQLVAFFHCVNSYPTPASDLNLRRLRRLKKAFGKPVGLSSHYPGTEDAIAAVALGAVAIEKHLTLARHQTGPDHAASLEPVQFQRMVTEVRAVEAMLALKPPGPQLSELQLREAVWGR
jgi:N-acetylneuraminate synthase